MVAHPAVPAGPAATAMDHLELQATATLSLAPGVRIDGVRLLRDERPVGDLSAHAAEMVESIAAGCTVAGLIEETVTRYAIAPEVAERDVRALVATLEGGRLVSIRQSYVSEGLRRAGHGWVDAYRALVYRIPVAAARYPTRRFPATLVGVATASLRAHLPTLGIGAALLSLIAILDISRSLATGLPVANRETLGVYQAVIAFFLLMPGSALVHEIGHLIAARALKAEVTSVFARMFVVGLTRHRLRGGRELLVDVSGGVAALLVLVALTPAVLMTAATPGATLGLLCAVAVVAMQHLFSLLPVTSEGRHIWRLIGAGLTGRRDAR